MNANERELILKEEVYAVVSCAIEVLNIRGHGLHEKIYDRVMYKAEIVGEYVPDLVAQEQLIVDTKTIERITDHERGQMLNYLRITGLPGGVILNFKHARLEWERLVLTKEPRRDANKRQSEVERADFLAPDERL